MTNETKITALAFDASQVEPQKPIEVIPAGWYPMEITDTEVKATKGRNGGLRALFEFTVISGDFKGRKVFAGFNVKNANAQAQEIGQRELSSVCHAVGIINVADLAGFIGKQLQVKVKIKRADEEDKKQGYEDRNEANGFKALEGAAPAPVAVPPPAPAPVAVPPPAPAAGSFPPVGWIAHPSAPGYFWNQATNEVKSEADLRAVAAPVAVPPPAPAAGSPPPWKTAPAA